MLKRILTLLVAMAIPLAALAADTKISAYPAMGALDGTEIFLGNQGGVTKTGLGSQFSTYIRGTFTAPPAIGGGTPAAGNFTTLGSSGLFSPSLGITAIGATINLNNNSNFGVNIGTGTSTGAVALGQNTATPGSITLNGPVTFNAGTLFSGASWATVSPVWNGAAMTLNDTTASGTITTEAAQSMQAANFTSTGGASTTITNASQLWVAAPTCSGGVVCTNLYSINTPGKVNFTLGAFISGATTNINQSSTFNTNINTGTNAATLTLGGATAGNIVNLASVSTKIGGALYASVTAPTISSHFNTSGDSIVAASTAAFQITVGNGAGTTTGAVTMPTATTGWACEATDVTTPASHAIQQTGSSTTLVTVTDYIRTTGIAQNFANGDKINFVCGAF